MRHGLRHGLSLGLLLNLGAALAQSPAPWSSLPVPSGVVAAQAVSQGKLVTYRDGGVLHVWSAVTRQWTSTPMSSTATLRVHNDCLLLQDGGTWIAFAAYRGTFEALPVTASAQLQNASGAVNDSLLAVADGSQLHTFSAFVGTWRARPLAIGHLFAVQRHVAVLVQGTLVSGLDAFHDQWHDHVVATPPAVVSADGTAGFAFGAGTIHAFSASRQSWDDGTTPPGAVFARGDDWGVWFTSNRTLGYSAVRGGFATSSLPMAAVASAQDVFALCSGAAGFFAFSALTGDFSPLLAIPTAQFTANTTAALLTAGGSTWGYSAVHNRAALLANVGPTSGVANVVAWVSDAANGPPWFFSALTCSWHRAPTNVLTGDPTLSTTAAACLTPNGCVAFSPRTGSFVPLQDPGLTLAANPSSAPLLAIGATTLHAFEARTGRWIGTPRSGSGQVSSQIWRTGAVLFDGNTAFGFGAPAGSWSSQVLPGPVVGLRANSESARVQTANAVFAWPAIGSMSWFAQFPEFRRVQPRDAAVAFVLDLPPGALAVVGIGVASATALPLPGLGELLLVPSGLATLAVVGNSQGVPVVVSLTPTTALRSGFEWAAQAAVWRPGASPYLSDMATFMPQ